MNWYESFMTDILARLQSPSKPSWADPFLASGRGQALQGYVTRIKDRQTGFPVPTLASPNVTQSGDRLRRRLAGGGRGSTLITGGLLGPAFTDKQGLRPV